MDTTNQTAELAAQVAQDPNAVLGDIATVILAVVLFLVGIILGLALARPSITRARVRLRALEAYLLEHPDCKDELVRSLARLDIRRLQERLGIDRDQD